MIFEHGSLYNAEGEVTGEAAVLGIERAAVRRPGHDVTLITYGGSLPKCLAAADELAASGVEAEVVDLRVLRPLDEATILASVRGHPPRRGRGRGVAHRQPGRRGERADHGGRLL